RKLAGTIFGDSRKELLAMAKLLETLPEDLFRPSVARIYELHRQGWQGSINKMAERYDISPTTLKQIMQAMERGGLSIPESKSRRQKRRSSAPKRGSTCPALKGQGNEVTNEGRSNEERIEESIKVVEDAVAALRQEPLDWDALGSCGKIRLLKEETLKRRGAAISQATLYREWCRSLW
ncbi:MAG: hypothetical protein AAFW75_26090, partial [Cyanobacteria bacterium J06636_16]